MSISSEITRITNNVQNTIDTIEATGVTVPEGANSDNLPSLAAALANEKQDKLTGTQGQVVGFDEDGNAVPQAAPNTGVTSFNGRTGAVTPKSGDYTAEMVRARPSTWTPTASDVGAVPTSRTVNGKALSSNITLTADDVNAASPPSSTTITLTTSGWSSNTQTVTVSGVSADETAQLIMPVPALASQTAYYEAGILVTGQAANSLTFTCSTVPSSNLTVYVVMQEVQ